MSKNRIGSSENDDSSRDILNSNGNGHHHQFKTARENYTPDLLDISTVAAFDKKRFSRRSEPYTNSVTPDINYVSQENI